MTRQVDALIIGAGPTGLTLGLCLLKQGMSVLIAEKHLHGLDFSRAILINSDTLRALAPYGVSEPLRTAGIAVNGFTMHVGGQVISQARYVVDDQDISHPVCLPQLQTEEILANRFLQAGGEILRGYVFDANHADLTATPVEVTLSSSEQGVEPISVQSKWVFGCDGFHSSVRSALDIDFPGSSLSVKPYAVDLVLSDWPFETNVNVFLDREGGCLAVQIGPNTVRLVTTTKKQRDDFMESLPVQRVTWDSTFDVHFHVATSYGRKEVWLAGDAVHVHSPVGGRGMNMGIIDAVTLAESVNSGDLDSYVQQRQQVAHEWVRLNERVSTVVLDSTARSRRARMALTMLLPLVGKVMGSRLANTAFSRLSASNLKLSAGS